MWNLTPNLIEITAKIVAIDFPRAKLATDRRRLGA